MDHTKSRFLTEYSANPLGCNLSSSNNNVSDAHIRTVLFPKLTFRLLSSSAYLSAFLIIFSMSSLLSPPEDWITTGPWAGEKRISRAKGTGISPLLKIKVK